MLNFRVVVWEDCCGVVEVIIVLYSNEWVPHLGCVNPLVEEVFFKVRYTFETKRAYLVNQI